MHRQACSDFFLDADNITSTLIRPLQERNISVETFLHSTTYCAASDARLVRFLQPVRHAFAPSNLPRIVDSYLQVMSMVEAYAVDRERVTSSNESYFDAVVLSRFDVRFTQSILDLNIDWGMINIAFRDGPPYWRKESKVSDLFFVYPGNDLGVKLRHAIDVSAGPFSHHSAAHWLLPHLMKSLNGLPMPHNTSVRPVNFIDPVGQGSNVLPEGTIPTFLYLDRSCEQFDDLARCGSKTRSRALGEIEGEDSGRSASLCRRVASVLPVVSDREKFCGHRLFVAGSGKPMGLQPYEFAEFYAAGSVVILFTALVAVALRVLYVQCALWCARRIRITMTKKHMEIGRR